MRNFTCVCCAESIDEADKRWDTLKNTSTCPRCGSVNFAWADLERPADMRGYPTRNETKPEASQMPARGFDGWFGSHLWLSIALLIGVSVFAQYLWTCRGLAGTAPSSTFAVALYVGAVALYMQITRVALLEIPSTSRQVLIGQAMFLGFIGCNWALHVILTRACVP